MCNKRCILVLFTFCIFPICFWLLPKHLHGEACFSDLTYFFIIPIIIEVLKYCICIFICSVNPPCRPGVSVWIKIMMQWWHTANTLAVQLTASPNIFLSPHGLQELNTITVYSQLSGLPQCTELMKFWWSRYINWSTHFLTDLLATLNDLFDINSFFWSTIKAIINS